MCKDGKCGKKCLTYVIAKILVIIGGINWGLVGVGILISPLSSWNLVDLIFGAGSIISSIIYILVGISAITMIFGCKCKTCKVSETTAPGQEMQ